MNKELIMHLRKLASREVRPEYDVLGICSEVTDIFGIEGELGIMSHFMSWKEFSGDINYPVPHFKHISPKLAYRLRKNMWDGEYGAARKRLCLHIANELEKEL